jgi:hypothetical protein
VTDSLLSAEVEAPETQVGRRYIWLMVLAQFGVFVAFITPLAISLAIKLSQLAPGRDEYLGYITGAGALAVMLAGPFLGIASDRTRSRIGRRRPFMIGGMALGVISLIVMATAPNVIVLGAGWVLAQLGWGQVLSNLQISTADRLPESQRGRVAGLTGFATQIAPVIGVGIAGILAADNLLLFLVPGAVGVVLVSLFVLFVHEDDSRGMEFPEDLSIRTFLSKLIFDPRQYPDYAWNWLGRFFFYFGLTPQHDVHRILLRLAARGLGDGGRWDDRDPLAGRDLRGHAGCARRRIPVRPVAPPARLRPFVGFDLRRRRGGDGLRRRPPHAGGRIPPRVVGHRHVLRYRPGTAARCAAGTRHGRRTLHEHHRFRHLDPSGCRAAGRTHVPSPGGSARAGEKNYLLLYLIAAACTVCGGLVVLRIRSVR